MNVYISVKNLNKSLWCFSTEVKRMVMERRERERERGRGGSKWCVEFSILFYAREGEAGVMDRWKIEKIKRVLKDAGS